MSYDPKTGGPCAVADIRRGALDDIAEVLRGYLARKKEESMNRDNQSQPITKTPWCIPGGEDNGTVICEGDDPNNPGQIVLVVRGPQGARQVYSYEYLSETTAFIVEAANSYASLKTRIEELEEALEKVRSYNVDIAAGRINYRPHDHIQVIDMALKGAE